MIIKHEAFFDDNIILISFLLFLLDLMTSCLAITITMFYFLKTGKLKETDH